MNDIGDPIADLGDLSERGAARPIRDRRPPTWGAGGSRILLMILLVVVVAMIAIGWTRLASDDASGGSRRGSHDPGVTVTAYDHEIPVLGRVSVIPPRFPADAFVHLGTTTVELVPREITSSSDRYLEREYAISPDGDRVVFVAGDEDGLPYLTVAGVDGSHPRVLVEERASAPAWSPDGSMVSFIRDGTTIAVVDVGTGRIDELARARQVWLPSFALDGRAILFTRSMRSGRDLGLWSVPVDGGAPTLVRTRAAFGAYSPDGSTIAFHRTGHAVDASVWPFDFAISLIDADGTDPRGLRVRNAGCCHMASFDWHWTRPKWSPDGTRLAYQRFGTMPEEIVVVDLATRDVSVVGEGALPVWVDDDTLLVEDLRPAERFEPTPSVGLGEDQVVLDLPTGDVSPLPGPIAERVTTEPDFAVSPDGSRIAFTGQADHEGRRAIFVADLDGGHLDQVSRGTTWVARHLSPAWSPDGAMLTYVADGPRFDVQHLYVVDLASGVRTSIAVAREAFEEFWAPVFTSDGRSILFTRRSPGPGRDTLDLWTVPMSGGRPSLLIHRAAFGVYSPDGTTIAYRRASPSDDDFSRPISLDVKLASAEGRPLGHLGDTGSMMAPPLAWPGEIPAWSPNGKRIVAIVGRTNRIRVGLVHVARGRGPALDANASAVWLDNHTLIVEEARG